MLTFQAPCIGDMDYKFILYTFGFGTIDWKQGMKSIYIIFELVSPAPFCLVENITKKEYYFGLEVMVSSCKTSMHLPFSS